MAYEIKYTDNINKGVIIVEEGDIDTTSTSLAFPGRDSRQYGGVIAENFLHLLENFASDTAPQTPVEGQLWYDTRSGIDQLKVYDGTNWTASGGLKKATSIPAVSNSVAGELWVNTDSQQLYLFTGTSWVLVGPNFSDGLLTGTESQEIIGTDNITYTVLAIKVKNIPTVIVSPSQFVPKAAISGFRAGIKPGLNLSTLIIAGAGVSKYWGTSEKAESLVIAEQAIPASSFLRGDSVSTTNFEFKVKNNNGITIGVGGQLSLAVDNEAGVIQNNTAGSNIDFRLRKGNRTPTVLRIDAEGLVGINNTAPEEALDVIGNVVTSGSLVVGSTENSTSFSSGSFVTKGSAGVAGNLNVGANAKITGDVIAGNIIPDSATERNVGTSALRYDQMHAQTFFGNLQGNVSGTVSGRAGSASRLASATTFGVTGDVENTSFAFDGQVGGTSKTFDIRIANSFIANKDPVSDVDSADEIIINRLVGDIGVFRVTKRNFLKSIPLIPVGAYMPFAGEEAPTGWLLCDGSEVDKSRYAELFTVIRYNFRDASLLSDQGVGTFALPDMRGRFPLGLDNMGGLSANTVTNPAADIIGGVNGSETVQVNTENLPEHEHDMEGESGTQYYGFRVGSGAPIDDDAITLSTEAGAGGTQGLASSGGVKTNNQLGQPLLVMNPFLGSNYIIYTGN